MRQALQWAVGSVYSFRIWEFPSSRVIEPNTVVLMRFRGVCISSDAKFECILTSGFPQASPIKVRVREIKFMQLLSKSRPHPVTTKGGLLPIRVVKHTSVYSGGPTPCPYTRNNILFSTPVRRIPAGGKNCGFRFHFQNQIP